MEALESQAVKWFMYLYVIMLCICGMNCLLMISGSAHCNELNAISMPGSELNMCDDE